jgi:hypothetical protein
METNRMRFPLWIISDNPVASSLCSKSRLSENHTLPLFRVSEPYKAALSSGQYTTPVLRIDWVRPGSGSQYESKSHARLV